MRTRREGSGLLGGAEVRHEARFQRVARVAGSVGAGEDADRAEGMEPRARGRGAIKYGQAQLDISDEMDVEADRARYEADRAKDIRLGRRRRHRCGDEAGSARRAAVSRRLPATTSPPARAIRPSSCRSGFVPNAPTPPFPDGSAPGRRHSASASRAWRAASRACSRSRTRSSRPRSAASRRSYSPDASVSLAQTHRARQSINSNQIKILCREELAKPGPLTIRQIPCTTRGTLKLINSPRGLWVSRRYESSWAVTTRSTRCRVCVGGHGASQSTKQTRSSKMETLSLCVSVLKQKKSSRVGTNRVK